MKVCIHMVPLYCGISAICANSDQDPYGRSQHLCQQRSSMQIALTHKGQAALWVTNGCTSMSKPITTKSLPMGVDNDYISILFFSLMIRRKHDIHYMPCSSHILSEMLPETHTMVKCDFSKIYNSVSNN